MTTLATSDLSWAAIQSILSDTGDAKLVDLCNHVNVEPLGLDPNYCAGGGVTARYTTLKTAPYEMGNFRGYMAPNGYIFVQAYADTVVYRCVFGETLHSSKTWDAGWQYYTGAAYTDTEFNQTLMVCYTKSVTDVAHNLGAVNNWVYGPVLPSSPVWEYRFQNQNWSLATGGGSPSLPAGSYWWCWRMGGGNFFTSDDYGTNDLFMPLTISDYLLSDPDEFIGYGSLGGPNSFEVWTGVYTSSTVVSGTVTLTGSTNGTGNRTQNFSVPPNYSGYPITHHILTAGAGVASSHVYIYQDA